MEELFIEILKQVYKCEVENLKEDEVDETFLSGACFGMKFMMNIISDCLNGDSEMVKGVYSD